MIKKTWQYKLNVIPHIFSPINFCVRTLVFFIIEENRIFVQCTKSIDFLQSIRCFSYKFVRKSLKFFKRLKHNKILNLLIIFIIRVAAGKILIFHLQRKKVCEEV